MFSDQKFHFINKQKLHKKFEYVELEKVVDTSEFPTNSLMLVFYLTLPDIKEQFSLNLHFSQSETGIDDHFKCNHLFNRFIKLKWRDYL